ncbi:stromal membrane-associated protein [Phyllosticta capitalensis]|uniref:Stromal membrane-associated protein n=1 Tax=Phyllosticta capitalensis TaxID=121624 RepID=A0ABR1YN91_9PEZI
MSRRVDPRAERAAQNQQTLKSLVKLEPNKSCADCKRNKHPRWASWNLGIFICIRCSGIHRGMGTHISRVKSVDLDSWTDEQLQSMLRWGNSRANKYWESKLAPGHIPSEAKIENFIRTKYESKRWIMDGPMPDPSTLDAEGDDDVPLNVVQEKAKLERSSSQRAAAATSSRSTAPPVKRQPTMDIFGDDTTSPPSRPSTGPPPVTRPPPPKAEPAPPKQSKPGDSLLGLDFFGGSGSSTPTRPASTASSAPSNAPRADLKQSILSLYAAKPAGQPAVKHQHTGSSGSFGGLQSPGLQSPNSQSSPMGGLNDAFSSLSMSMAPQQAPKPSPFADLMNATPKSATPASSHQQSGSSSGFGSGGGFFDSLPAAKPANPPQPSRTFSSNSGFGDFSSSISPVAANPPKPAASSTTGDLFDLSFDAPAPAPGPVPAAAQTKPPMSPGTNSAFNLSSPTAPSQPPQPKPQPAVNYASGLSNLDAWGSNDAWSSTTTATSNATATAPSVSTPASTTSGWGSATTPQVSHDDDFGGWNSAVGNSSAASNPAPKPVSNLPGDDLFANVWE